MDEGQARDWALRWIQSLTESAAVLLGKFAAILAQKDVKFPLGMLPGSIQHHSLKLMEQKHSLEKLRHP